MSDLQSLMNDGRTKRVLKIGKALKAHNLVRAAKTSHQIYKGFIDPKASLPSLWLFISREGKKSEIVLFEDRDLIHGAGKILDLYTATYVHSTIAQLRSPKTGDLDFENLVCTVAVDGRNHDNTYRITQPFSFVKDEVEWHEPLKWNTGFFKRSEITRLSEQLGSVEHKLDSER